MPELLTPGVYIQEVDFGPNPIEGVSTSTAGFVGEAELGPVSGPPLLVTSFPDFQRKFGGFVKGKALAYAVRGFFDNGGKRAFISRVVGGSALKAEKDFLSTGARVRLLAPSIPGTSGAPSTLTLSSVVGLEIGAAKLDLIDFATNTPVAYQVLTVNSSTGVVTINTSSVSVSPDTHYAELKPTAAEPGSTALTLIAKDPGAFGNQLSAFVEAHYVNSTSIKVKIAGDKYVLGAVDFLAVGDKTQLITASGAREIRTITAIDASTNTVTFDGGIGTDFLGGKAFLIGWRVTVLYDGAIVETISDISAAMTGSFALNFEAALEAKSKWIRVKTAGATLINPQNNAFPSFALGKPVLLAGGSDGSALTGSDVVGVDTAPRTGLKAIEAQKEVNLIAAPIIFTGTAAVILAQRAIVASELIAQAERKMDRFAVFEAAQDANVASALNERGNYNSRFAAMYHPWVTMLDPLTKTDIVVPPSGHVLGAYARTDNERGVFKAPANVVLRSITGFAQDVPDGEQDLLNPAGVNVLRRFDGLGNVIWGARTISAEGLWKYVPVRRLFIFLEQSIIKGTRYAVFEPNDLKLWARLRDSLVNFLTTQWRAGALFGKKPEEAFFVKVDETTTTQDDRDNGRVNILVGIAPVKPAEFIVFQIGQAPQSAIIAEQS